MQLFISQNYTQQNNNIIINDEIIIHQCLHVLKMKVGQSVMIQDQYKTIRYTITIKEINKQNIIWYIQHIDNHTIKKDYQIIMCIALPNRHEKSELIVQKLSEIGVNTIIFFPSDRSIIRHLSDKKLQRLYMISKEAIEQSFGRSLPLLSMEDSLDTVLKISSKDKGSIHILLDHQGTDASIINIKDKKNIYMYIWPEWWFTWEEKKCILQNDKSISLCLGDTNLRMETAAIIGSRISKNLNISK